MGEIVFSGRKQVVLVRPYEGSLQMAMLNYAAQIEQPAAAKPGRVAVSEKSLELAEELIESWTEKHFDFAHYVDRYEEDIRKLIEAKVHGRDISRLRSGGRTGRLQPDGRAAKVDGPQSAETRSTGSALKWPTRGAGGSTQAPIGPPTRVLTITTNRNETPSGPSGRNGRIRTVRDRSSSPPPGPPGCNRDNPSHAAGAA